MNELIPSNRNDDSDPLDELIQRAMACEVDAQSLNHLVERWNTVHSEQPRKRPWVSLAVAASAAVLAGTLVFFAATRREAHRDRNSSGQQSVEEVDGNTDESATESGTAVVNNTVESLPTHEHALAVDLTPYERVLVHAALQSQGSDDRRRALAVRRNIIASLERLESIDDQTSEKLATDLGISMIELEKELERLCLVLHGRRRQKAIKLLGRIATRESLDVLLQLWNQPVHQDQVAAAVARLASVSTLTKCYLRATSAHSRGLVAASLVQNASPADVGLLLQLLSRTHRADELLAALANADDTLAAAFLAELDSENRSVRYVAAQVVGALNNAEVTRRLVERVIHNHRRPEALVALAVSAEPTAVVFMAQAKRHAVLATAIQSALVQARSSQWFHGG